MQQELNYSQELFYLTKIVGTIIISGGIATTSLYHFGGKWAYKRLDPMKQLELGKPTLSYALKQTKRFFTSFVNKKIDITDIYTQALIEQINREQKQGELRLEKRF